MKRAPFWLWLPAVFIACQNGSSTATIELSSDKTTLTLKRGSNVLLTFPADAFQLGLTDGYDSSQSYDPYWFVQSGQPPTGIEWEVATGYKLMSQSDGGLTVEIDYPQGSASLSLTPDAAGRFTGVLTPSTTNSLSTAYMRLRPRASATESFYGLGELPDSVNSRGQIRPAQIEINAGAEGASNEFHAPIPLLIGTRGWGIFVESRRPGVFDVATQDPTVVDIIFGTATDSASGLRFHLLTADEPLDIIKHYYDLTGYPKLPAVWALGPWIWRDNLASQAQAEDDIQQIDTLQVPTSGYWLDRPYASGVETFDYDPSLFTNAPQLIQDLHDSGMRVAVWHSPYVAPAGNSEASPVYNAQAQAMGFFPPMTGLLLNGWSKPIDFTNAAAVSWWQSLLHNYTDGGIEGFKLDYGEDVQVGIDGVRDPWQFSNGSDELTMQSEYQILYHQTYSQLLPSTGGFLLCRTARWGDQVNGAIIWPGDLDASFALAGDIGSNGMSLVGGLPAAVVKGLSLSASGFPFFASDTGGYRSAPPDIETYIRWIEANAMFVAMEAGDASSEVPWSLATGTSAQQSEALADYIQYTGLQLRLFPYKWTYVQNMLSDGRPITRPFGLAFPGLGADPSDEFLLGDSILSAPVVAQGQTTKTLVLPPGTWIGWWDGAPHAGSATSATQLQVSADLDTLPLFIAQGGIVPMLAPTIRTLAPVAAGNPSGSYANNPGVLYVRVAPSTTATSFTVFDGTKITQQSKGAGVQLTVAQGSTFGSGTVFEVIATAQPASVTLNGTSVAHAESMAALTSGSGWFWESATGGTLWISIPAAAKSSITAQ